MFIFQYFCVCIISSYGHKTILNRFLDEKEAIAYKNSLSTDTYPLVSIEHKNLTIFDSKEEAIEKDLEKEKEELLKKLTKREKEILGLK